LLAFGARDEVVVIQGALPYSFPTSPNSFVEGGGAAVGWYGSPPPPPFVEELLGLNQIASPLGMASSECS
jgi:hypothetical protein